MPSIPLDLHLPGSGSTTEKQERACKVALVVAAVKGPLPSGGTRPGDGSRSIRSLIFLIYVATIKEVLSSELLSASVHFVSITGHLALLQSEGKSVEEAKVVAPRQW